MRGRSPARRTARARRAHTASALLRPAAGFGASETIVCSRFPPKRVACPVVVRKCLREHECRGQAEGAGAYGGAARGAPRRRWPRARGSGHRRPGGSKRESSDNKRGNLEKRLASQSINAHTAAVPIWGPLPQPRKDRARAGASWRARTGLRPPAEKKTCLGAGGARCVRERQGPDPMVLAGPAQPELLGLGAAEKGRVLCGAHT
ncbi:MAG: hypothetical protein J3K34DRAFT_407854 [Monoraphidium minutum]|nr:MAG: hypothetical protein J3K34DRAFT_407854 [Monoraphidium minutum]